jgi:hypothetical protein
MYLVAIAWLYAALMWALAEAFDSNGTLLGAFFTFTLYGLAPVALVMYILNAPARGRARRAAEQAAAAPPEASGERSDQPDAGRHAAGDAVAAERKEP